MKNFFDGIVASLFIICAMIVAVITTAIVFSPFLIPVMLVYYLLFR